MSAKYVIKMGETLNLQLTALSGTLNSVISVSSSLKKATGSGSIPSADVPKIADFIVTNITDGWNFSLGSNTTNTLTPGMYITDAKLILSTGEILITEPVIIEVRSSVT